MINEYKLIEKITAVDSSKTCVNQQFVILYEKIRQLKQNQIFS